MAQGLTIEEAAAAFGKPVPHIEAVAKNRQFTTDNPVSANLVSFRYILSPNINCDSPH